MGFPATIQQTDRSRSRPVSQPCAIKSNPRVNTKTQEEHARTYAYDSSSEVGGREGKLVADPFSAFAATQPNPCLQTLEDDLDPRPTTTDPDANTRPDSI